jgi:abortive infection bacteriophage resistance protein
MSYDKPYKDINDLIQILKDRGLTITNDEIAKTILRSYSYYDLVNGYKTMLMPNDTFSPGTTIEYLRDFYILDKELQSLCMKYSLIVETSLKYCLADVIACNYGVHQDDYLNSRHYKDKYNNLYFASVKLEILRSTIPRSAHQPTKHYIEHHNHIPPWILFKNISLGATINLFKLLNQQNKSNVVQLMIPHKALNISEKTNLLITALDGIRLFRNAGAHNLNFVNSRFKYPLPIPLLKKILPPYLFNDSTISNQISDRDSASGLYGIILCFLALINDANTKYALANEFKRALYRPHNSTDSAIRQILHGPYKQLSLIPANAEIRLSNYISNL